MAIDISHTQEILHTRLNASVKVVARPDGALVLETPFRFPDGDHFPMYVTARTEGIVRLSDGGHTFMHLSYDNEISILRDEKGQRLLDQILRDTGSSESEGEFYIDADWSDMGEAVFRLGQALTRICDLLYLQRLGARRD